MAELSQKMMATSPVGLTDIGGGGVSHAKEILGYGNLLCNFASEALDSFKEAGAFTFSRIKIPKVFDASQGGLIGGVMSLPFSEYLYLKNKHYSCVFDDVMASPNDTYYEESFARKVVVEGSIYKLASVNNFKSSSHALKLIRQVAVSWYFACVLLEKPLILSEQFSFTDLDPDDVVEIVDGAFDGEGFIVIRDLCSDKN